MTIGEISFPHLPCSEATWLKTIANKKGSGLTLEERDSAKWSVEGKSGIIVSRQQ